MATSASGGVRLYISRQAASLWRYLLEQTVTALFGWVPSIIGIGLRALTYRLILKADGHFAIENGVRLAYASGIRLGRGAYLDRGVYLHACPNGIEIGEGSLVMANSILHVYNFRGLPHAGIRLGRNALIGEANVIRGQGGVTIGDNVYTAPLVQILAVNHVIDDPTRPIIAQGITAQGIVIEDDCWIGAGAIITDGVTIGRGCAIGAGAVVTRDIPPHSLAVGVPARIVRDLSKPVAPEQRARHGEAFC